MSRANYVPPKWSKDVSPRVKDLHRQFHSVNGTDHIKAMLIAAKLSDFMAILNGDPVVADLQVGGIESIRTAVTAMFARAPLLGPREPVDKAIRRARKHLQGQAAHHAALVSLIEQMDVVAPPADCNPPDLFRQLNLGKAVNRLKRMKCYANPSAISEAFRGIIRAGHMAAVQNRYWAYCLDMDRVSKQETAKRKGDLIPYQRRDLRLVCDAVIEGRAGVCTSFAMAAAHLLMGDKPEAELGFRLEIVAAKNHCFVLVNRSMADVRNPDIEHENQIPGFPLWSDDTIIVDAWLYSMGYDCFFTVATHPKHSLLDGLSQNYDSRNPRERRAGGQSAIMGLAFGRLKKAKQKLECPKCKADQDQIEDFSSPSVPAGYKCRSCGHSAKKSVFYP